MQDIYFLLLDLAIIIALALLPWGVRRWFPKLRLPKWVCICISTLVGLVGTVCFFIIFVVLPMFSFWSPRDLTKDPACARAYLNDIEFPMELPGFKVEKHCFEFVGGDDTEETWILSFKKPLSPEFTHALDSLCMKEPRWDRTDTTYTYSYWNPVDIELHEMVVIEPRKQRATLTHLKI